ncbi:hypothetical protein D3C84_991250 [compost metagenome]
MPGDDVHRGSHARNDQQRLVVTAQVIFVGAHLDQVKGIALVIGHGVGADQFQLGFEPAVDGVVVRTELDHRRLPRMQERDVLRADLRFDQQVVFQRHDLQQVAARLDHAANGVDLEQLDDAMHRRHYRGARDPVINGDA